MSTDDVFSSGFGTTLDLIITRRWMGGYGSGD